jgi:hypothetical protein
VRRRRRRLDPLIRATSVLLLRVDVIIVAGLLCICKV